MLVASGYSCILFGLFYGVIDVWKIRRWTTPLLWIGTNALALYLVRNLINFDRLAPRLAGGDIRAAVGEPAGAAAGIGFAGFDARSGSLPLPPADIPESVIV